jgi:hypothetical protein
VDCVTEIDVNGKMDNAMDATAVSDHIDKAETTNRLTDVVRRVTTGKMVRPAGVGLLQRSAGCKSLPGCDEDDSDDDCFIPVRGSRPTMALGDRPAISSISAPFFEKGEQKNLSVHLDRLREDSDDDEDMCLLDSRASSERR